MKSFKTSICSDSQRETLQRVGKTCWKMATLPVMNLLSVTTLLEAHWKKEAREKSLPKMSIKQPNPPLIRHQIGWEPNGEQGSERYILWSWSRLYLFTLKWIFSMTGLQTPWYLISRCVKQKRDPNINSKQILSSNPALPQYQGRIWLILLTSTWSFWHLS